jgi:MoxR-vWA-beta-propeller ternary system domain bpX2
MVLALEQICLARMPAAALAALAEMRTTPGVEVARDGDWAWIRWQAGEEAVLRRLLPVFGVQLYEQRDGRWHQAGCCLPAFEVPARLEYRPLLEEVTPARVTGRPPPALSAQPVVLRLVADDVMRPTTAMECRLQDFARWMDDVPAARLQHLRAAHCCGRLLVRGERLPLLVDSDRFWGKRVLVPLGSRLDPALPESAYHEALGVEASETLLFRHDFCEIIPGESFSAVTRAGVRQLLRVDG